MVGFVSPQPAGRLGADIDVERLPVIVRIEARRLLVLGRSRCDSPQARVNMGPSKLDLFVPKHGR
jgi:hypothetical protein